MNWNEDFLQLIYVNIRLSCRKNDRFVIEMYLTFALQQLFIIFRNRRFAHAHQRKKLYFEITFTFEHYTSNCSQSILHFRLLHHQTICKRVFLHNINFLANRRLVKVFRKLLTKSLLRIFHISSKKLFTNRFWSHERQHWTICIDFDFCKKLLFEILW